MKRSAFVTSLLALFPAIAFAAVVPKVAVKKKPMLRLVTLTDGLKYIDLKAGTGAEPKTGQTVTVNYTGTLADGTVFDASSKHGGTFDFPIGEGHVIKGWDEGVATMRVGGRRKLIIPPELGYGAQGAGNVIPPNATLTFVIDLIKLS
jgi:peptidylprolyl isomerase